MNFAVSRAPGKRKIKVQEKNLLELLEEDDDDEEDEDFQINQNQEREVDGMIKLLHQSIAIV